MLDLEENELEKLSKKDKGVGEYMGEIRKLNGEVVFREYMSEEEDKRKIYNTEMKLAREKGLKQGIEQGMEQGIEQGIEKGIEQGIEQGIEIGKQSVMIETAKKMLKEKIDINTISKVTNLSVDEIKKLGSY